MTEVEVIVALNISPKNINLRKIYARTAINGHCSIA